MMTGMTEIITPVAIMPMSWKWSPMKARMPMGKVRLSGSVMSTTANRNSFQSWMKFRISVVAMAGMPTGSTMRQKISRSP